MGPGLATALTTLIAALLFDRFLGEYPASIHPVVWIGKIVSLLLKVAPRKEWWRPFAFGTCLAIGVPTFSGVGAWFVLHLADGIPWLEIVLGTFLLKASFALRELGAAAERVRAPVEAGDLPRAREALRCLCSRDPGQLDEEALLAATVQSLAENASDSFVAPLFYFLLFGVPGTIAYRAINTLDAMVGYRGPFEALGKASARLDDAANWIPARLTALLLLFAGWLSGWNAARGWRIFRRDGAKTPSPNGGRPMAMMAGLLGVQLEKKGVYVLGDRDNPIVPMTVRYAWRLVVLASWFASGLCVLLSLLLFLFRLVD
jgi:adenosylcobinamide-phosphate synthase